MAGRGQGSAGHGLVRAFVVACLAWLAWRNRFVQDDAFISFRYARNLAEGHGLVWNLGERVEGYTNFLWTVFLTPSFWLGVDVVLYSYTLSLAAFCCTLWLTWVIADDLWEDRRAGLAAAVLLGTNQAFSNYGTGGLETQFMTAWTLGALAALGKWRGTEKTGWLLMAAAASVGALMTRLDAALLLGFAWVWAATRLWRRAAWREFFYLALIVLPPLSAWFIWKHAYYGNWLPNTALIKVGAGGPTWARGLFYAGLFYLLYGFVLAVPLCLSGLARVLRKPWIICAVVTLLAWHGYIVWVGGDFMEFRMLMPALPLVMVWLVGGLLQSAAWARGVAVLCLMACSLAQGVRQWNYPCTEPKHQLQANAEKWRGVAETLNGVFGEDRHALKIGVTAAGAVPFYTGMPALDLLGLNDRDVALHGDRIEPLVPRLGNRPGHVKMATQQQVRGKGVHLLLNNPWVVSAAELAGLSADRVRRRWNVAEGGDERRLSWERVDWAEDGGFTRVVAWPCPDDNYLLSLYIRADERIDRAIKRSQAIVLR